MELHEGPIMLKDLSIWFGLKPDTLAKSRPGTRDKKLKVLNGFADWHYEGKKIIIDKVKVSIYSKAYEIIEKEAPKEWGNVRDKDNKITPAGKFKVDTGARVGKSIYNKNHEVSAQVSESTVCSYVGAWKRKNYGRNHIMDDYGECGRSQYVWMNKEGTDILDADSRKIIRECAEKAYGEKSERIAVIDDAYHKGEISKDEREEALLDSCATTESCYALFVALVTEKLGFFPEKRTQLIDMLSWGNNK